MRPQERPPGSDAPSQVLRQLGEELLSPNQLANLARGRRRGALGGTLVGHRGQLVASLGEKTWSRLRRFADP